MSALKITMRRLMIVIGFAFLASFITGGIASADENPFGDLVSAVTQFGPSAAQDPQAAIAAVQSAAEAVKHQVVSDPQAALRNAQTIPAEAYVAPAPIQSNIPAPAPVTPVAVGTVVQDVLDPAASAAISVYNGKVIPMPAQQEFDNTKSLDVQVAEAAELFTQSTVTADASACGQTGFNQMVACEAAEVDANNGAATVAPITVSNRYNPVTIHSIEPMCGNFYSINYCEGAGGSDHVNLNRTAFDALADKAPAKREDLMFVIVAHEDGHSQDQNGGHVAGIDFLEWATADKSHAEERVYPMEQSADTHAGNTYREAVRVGDKTPTSYDLVSETMKMMGGDAAHGTGQQRFDAFTGIDTISFSELLATAGGAK